MSAFTIGIFVGGSGRRMGGVSKGLLRTPDGSRTLVERLLGVCAHVAPSASVYLVGRSAAYAQLEIARLEDVPEGIGPLGGLHSLLLRAKEEHATALALACDLPFLDEAVLTRLLEPLQGAARVPFVQERFQPLAAAYAPAATLAAVERALAQGKHALMHVLDELGHDLEQLEFDDEQARALRDWDTPEDMLPH
ncbi:MAG: molybdenum cofactor guanylyltransferase [Pseudomonadota bacterium]